MPPPPALGTAEIPQQYWEAAMLIGKTPFVASTYDQRASYSLYVPPQHYTLPTPGEEETRKRLRLIVTMHGSGRNAERCRDAFAPLADRVGAAVLAPLFPAGINDPNDTHNYKGLAYDGIRYDLILLGILDEVKARWPGIETGKVSLMGYSGGGQFALRFFYLYPERIENVSIGAPGVTTRLDEGLDWPRGLRGVDAIFDGRSVDVAALKKVENVQLIVGGDDVQEVGGGLLQWLREKKNGNVDGVVKVLGSSSSLPNRKEALLSLHEEFQALGIKSKFAIVDGAAHENMKVNAKVIEWFLEPILTKSK